VLAVRGQKILRMVTSPGFLTRTLPHKHNFLKLKHENIIKMKNKPDPALLKPSNLSNEINKRVPKFRETIPLMVCLQISFQSSGSVQFLHRLASKFCTF
jgi:hypothetical protein